MPRRNGRRDAQWGARLLAPAAFLAAATVAVLVIRAGLDSNGPEPTATLPAVTTRPARTAPTTTGRARPPAPVRRTYAIQEGDTLDQVALDHDTTVERLLELNPSIDPTSLQVGQRIVVPG
jgi:hypothetical protein